MDHQLREGVLSKCDELRESLSFIRMGEHSA